MELLERSTQVDALDAAVSQAVGGCGSVVLVSGEPGIGKTALVAGFVAGLQHRVLWGTCDDLTVPRPLAPLTDLVGQVSDELGAAVQGGGAPSTVHPLMLAELSHSPPTVLVLEDMHWADEATLDVLTFVGRRVASLPAVVVVTFREGEVAGDDPLWATIGSLPRERTRHLRLEPLSRGAVASLAGPAADRVYALTGGNPFYVTELLAAGREDVPPSVANAVLGRAARLAAGSRKLVELVSMVPARASATLLDVVMPDWPAAAEEPERRGLLQVDAAQVRFRHELARSAIRSSVPVARRRRLHTEITRALLALDAAPAEIVHHAEAAGDQDLVAEHAWTAARRSAAAESNREAFAHYRRAADFTDRLTPREQADLFEELAQAAYLADRLPASLAAVDRAIAIAESLGDRERLGRCLRLRSRFAWYAGDGELAREQARAAVDVLEPHGDSVELARAYAAMAQLAMLALDVQPAREWGDRAAALATALGDETTRVHALVTLGSARCGADPDDWRPLLHAHEAADRAGERHEAVRALLNLADFMFSWVRPEPAWKHNQRAIAYADEHQVDTLLFHLTAMAGWHRLRFGDWAAAERLSELAGLERSVTQILVRTALAELAVRRGGPDAADRVAEVAEQAEHTRELQWIAPVLELEMELALLEDRALPVERIRWARDLVGRQVWEAEAYGARLTGWAAMSGVTLPWPRPMPPPHAEMVAGDWRAAAAAFDRVGWEYDAALMASLLDDEPELVRALEVARRLDARLLEARVVRRLRRLGFRVPRGPQRATRANPAGLTPREVEVLALLADGLTNDEIAARLQLSSRTAEHHVSAVLGKLAVRSRRHAVRRAAELGILGRV